MAHGFTADYRPLYFLSSLGMGGLSVSFFVYLMFLAPHPGEPIPSFQHIVPLYADGSLTVQLLTTLTLLAIGYFAVRHFVLLVRNLRAWRTFSRSAAYASFRQSNAEVQVMAIPLTLAMSVNVVLILAALAVPGLWGVKEFLFPFALLAVSAIAVYALWLFGRYVARIIGHSGFDAEDTNHFSQVLPSFAFAMIATGFSSSAAMSDTKATAVIGMFGSFLFLAAAAAWIMVKLPVSFAAILRKGMAVEAGPTLWMGIPIFTLVGITLIRDLSGIGHTLMGVSLNPVIWFVLFGLLVAGQTMMGLFGYAVMRKQNYFSQFVSGEGRSIASYGLICPGVAYSVLVMFFLHWGLVAPGIVTKFSLLHYLLLLVPLATQLITIKVVFQLNRKLMGRARNFRPETKAAQAV